MSRTCIACGAPVSPTRTPRWNKDGFDIIDCPSCGLLFRRELPDPSELTAIYASDYFEHPRGGDAQGYLDYVGDEQLHRLVARKRLRLLGRHSSPGRLLDVGAAAGFFVDEARSSSWDAAGIDVAASMTEWGRERLGIELHAAVFEDSDIPADSYDCVTMWDYVEHSLDPARCFQRAHEILRPGGVLALSTGDAGSAVARLSGARWHLLTPRHHNYYFNQRSLRRALERTGFDSIGMTHPSAPYSLAYCVHKLGTMAPRSRAVQRASRWIASRRIGELRIPVNLWDIVTVVARRR